MVPTISARQAVAPARPSPPDRRRAATTWRTARDWRPNRRVSRAPTKTEVMARQIPQPQKIRPSWWAPKLVRPAAFAAASSGNGRVGQQAEEAEVVEERRDPERQQSGVPQRPEGAPTAGPASGGVRPPGRARSEGAPGRSPSASRCRRTGPARRCAPSAPPSSGPMAMPRPSAASYRMIALSAPPAAAPTIVASAVEMNSALPRPQPARKPMIMFTESDAPASAAKTRSGPGRPAASASRRSGWRRSW